MKTYDRSLKWLVDSADPGPKYLALRDLVDTGTGELKSARAAAHRSGEIAQVLSMMNPEGYWAKPGPGYMPKYTSGAWSIIVLAQLGARVEEDQRIDVACRYYLEHALTPGGQISSNGAPGGTIDCLQGNMLASMLDLGYEDARLEGALEWMARSLTGEGVAPMGDKGGGPRYYAGKVGPDFACGANNKLPCAWGGVKVMMAFSKLPRAKRTQVIERAIKAGVDFLLSTDPAEAGYPSGWSAKPSGNWWKFGFPVFYVTDLLQNVEALVGLGYVKDPRLAQALDLIREKQDAEGRWPLDYDYAGKTWVDFGAKNKPNKWVTLRALRVLKAAGDFQ
jgi:hypothetical protein